MTHAMTIERAFKRWRCTDCYKIVHEWELLEAPNPFDPEDTIIGCPKCKSVESFEEVCDEAGCEAMATCGWPDGNGYRRTCSRHANLK